MTRAHPPTYVPTGAAFARLSGRTLIEVRGDDRAKFLHNLCTNDVMKLGVGAGCEAFFTNVQGKVLLHAILFCDAQSIVIDAVPGQAESMLPHLDKYLITEDVTLADRSDDWSEFWLAGSDVEPRLRDLGMDIGREMLSHTVGELAGISCRIGRVPFANGPCFLLRTDQTCEDSLLLQIEAMGFQQIAGATVEALRIEMGYPSYGRDITAANLPQEVGRDGLAISFTKGCYLGQETVARIDALGHVNKKLVRLEFETDDEPPPDGTELRCDEKVVGHVTSSCRSVTDNRILGLGYVRRVAIESGSSLSCDFGSVSIVPSDTSERL